MAVSLATGYLRLGIEADKIAWSRRGLNMQQLYEANQSVLARRLDEAKHNFSLVIEPSLPHERFLYWCSLARLYALAGEPHREVELMAAAGANQTRLSIPLQACYALRQAVFLRSRGNDQQSLEQALHAASLVSNRSHHVIQGFAASEIGLSLLKLGDAYGASRHLQKSFSLLFDQLSSQQLATLGISLGLVYMRIQAFDKSIEVLRQIVDLGNDVVGNRNMVKAIFAIGTAEHQLGNYAKALEYYHALQETYSEEIEDDLSLQLLSCIGDALCEVGNIASARVILDTDSGRIDQAAPSTRQEILATFGKIHARIGNRDIAKTYYLQALQIARSNNALMQHRLLLEDFIASGSIDNETELLAMYRELVSVHSASASSVVMDIDRTHAFHASLITTSIKQSSDRHRELVQLMNQAQDRAINAIGSHLHATTLQSLALLHLRLEGVHHQLLIEEMHSSVTAEVFDALQSVTNIAQQIRDISHLSHQHHVSGSNLSGAIRDYVEYLQRNITGSTLMFTTSGLQINVSDELARSIYRCIQICTQNAILHAAPSKISVDISASSARLNIMVGDDGCGFDDAANTEGVGLRELHSRVHYAGGKVVIDTQVGSGTTVTMSFPTPPRSGSPKKDIARF